MAKAGEAQVSASAFEDIDDESLEKELREREDRERKKSEETKAEKTDKKPEPNKQEQTEQEWGTSAQEERPKSLAERINQDAISHTVAGKDIKEKDLSSQVGASYLGGKPQPDKYISNPNQKNSLDKYVSGRGANPNDLYSGKSQQDVWAQKKERGVNDMYNPNEPAGLDDYMPGGAGYTMGGDEEEEDASSLGAMYKRHAN